MLDRLSGPFLYMDFFMYIFLVKGKKKNMKLSDPFKYFVRKRFFLHGLDLIENKVIEHYFSLA